MKHFIITVDTEGDNLWEYKKGTPIGTENAKYLPRFQSLCEKSLLSRLEIIGPEKARI